MYLPVAGVEVNPVLPPFIGLAVGVLAGMFGVGGGFLITPILIWFGIPSGPAVASGLNQVVGSSASAAMANALKGNVSYRLGLIVGASGLVSGLAAVFAVSALLARGQFGFVIGIVYTVLLSVVGLKMTLELWRVGGEPEGAPGQPGASSAGLAFKGLLLGLGAGVLSAFLGVGGGIVLVPAMIYLMGVPTRKAVGTSLFQVVVIAFGTTVFHSAQNQMVDVVLAMLIMIGSIPGALLGVWISHKLNTKSLKGLFGLLVLTVAIGTAYSTFFGESGMSPQPTPPPEHVNAFLAFIRDSSATSPLVYGLASAATALVLGCALGWASSSIFRARGRKPERDATVLAERSRA